MTNPLAKRLTIRIMAVVLVMMGVITGAVYYSVREYMLEEAQERYAGVLLRNLEELRRRLSDVYVATHNNLHFIEQDVENPEKVTEHLRRMVSNNKSMVTCGVLYEPNHFTNKKRCLELYATRDSAGVVHTGSIESDRNFYTGWECYKRVMENDSADWSEVYFETNDLLRNGQQRQLTTYCEPLHDREGRTVAILGSDLLLEFLRREFMEDILAINQKYEKGSDHQSYSFVIDRNGNYIMHPDESRMHKKNFFEDARSSGNAIADNVMTNMKERENGAATLDIDGVPSWIYYRTVKHVGWTIAIVVPEEVIFRNGRMLNGIILLIVIAGLIAIYFICRRMINDTTTPVTAQQAALEHELKIASNIQMAMLPKSPQPTDSTQQLYDIYASETPAREVGGDLYDYFVRAGRLFFCIGDVSGKGMPAALLMAVMRTLFRSEARRSDNAADIVETMNRLLCEENTADYFVTMFVGILDLTTGRLDYCNAGHEAPVVGGQPLNIKRNLPVGILPEWEYEGQQTQLLSGDMIFLYTDGLSEAENHAGKRLGRSHVQQLASQHTDETPQQLVQLMEDEVRRHAADTEQSDDITLLAVKWLKEQESMQCTLHASMDEISRLQPFVEQASQQAGLSDKESKRLRLAVEEAVANVINYGQATTITLTAQADKGLPTEEAGGGVLTLTIDDDGQPFDPTQGSDTDLTVPPDQRPPGGMGIILLQRMTDSLSYQRTDGHNILTLTKNINK